ncbi:MAG TPA: hypothetical protein VE195_08745, partial [Acidobacteriaceae bacterium]|nr:hypothetical protein [Acidobacteriaceae bacterium]
MATFWRNAYVGASHNGYEWTTGTFGFADSREVVEKDECPTPVVPAGAPPPSGYVGSSPVGPSCSVAENVTKYQRQPGTAIS